MKSLPVGYIEARLLWVFGAGAMAIVACILLFHLLKETPGVTSDVATPPKTSWDEIRTDAVARIAEESRGMLPPPVVEAAPLAIQDAASQAANDYRSPTLPDGYSLVGFNGEMNKAAIRDHGDDSHQVDDGLDWLGSPTAIENLVAQAAATGRGWSFGWIRLAGDTRRADLAKLVEGAGVKIVGSAGRLLRAQLPGDAGRLAAIAALPEVDGLGALPVEAKLRAFEVPSVELPGDEPTPVFVTLMADDVDGR